MAVTLTGSSGLFTRLGKLLGFAKRIRTTQLNLVNDIDSGGQCYTDFIASIGSHGSQMPYMWWTGPLNENIEAQVNGIGVIQDNMRKVAATILVEMVRNDSSSLYKGDNVDLAFEELNRQMIAAGVGSASLDASTVTIGTLTADGGNTGDGTLVTYINPSAITAPSLASYPCARTETVVCQCIQDSQSKGIKSGAEVFNVEGGRAYPNWDYRFPGGGGQYGTVKTISTAYDSKKGVCQQHLYNGGFERQVSNVPLHWTLVTGTAGTDVETTTTAFRGTNAIKITGDGSVQHQLKQQLGNVTGTTSTLEPDTAYVIAAALRRGASAETGVLRIELVDASNTIIDAKSINCRLEVDLSSLTTSYVLKTQTFRTPKSLPSDVYYRIFFSTALSSTRETYISDVILAPLYQLNKGGIFVGIISGAADWTIDDKLDQVVTNNDEGEWFKELDRYFDLNGTGMMLPAETDGSETVADSLIS